MARAPRSSSPERALVALAAAGDRLAFGELVRRHGSAVRVVLRRMGAETSLADDIAQDAFVLAWKRIAALRDGDAFQPWVKRIAARLYIKRWRRLARERPVEAAPDHSFSFDPSMSLDLDAALAGLSQAERMCVTLCSGVGYTHEEAAMVLKLPVGTVKSHVRRGIQRLKTCLEDKELAHDRRL